MLVLSFESWIFSFLYYTNDADVTSSSTKTVQHWIKNVCLEILEQRSLKEQCHEDFAVLGQFCAKIITLRL